MEENKVAQAFQKVICDGLLHSSPNHGIDVRKLTDFILQSPDLRVTLVEPRFRIEHKPTLNEYWLMETQSYPIQGNVVIIAKLEDGEWAEKVLTYLNSKEPK